MLSYLFDEQAELEKFRAAEREEWLAEGKAEGKAEGIELGTKNGIAIGEERGTLKTLISLVKKKLLTLSDAAANMTVSEFESLPGMQNA